MPLIITINGFTLSLLFAVALLVLVFAWTGIYYTHSVIVGNVAYQTEIAKHKQLVSTIDSLRHLIEEKIEFVEEISLLETDLSLSYGVSPTYAEIKKQGVGGRKSYSDKLRITLGTPLENRIADIHDDISGNERQFDFLKTRLEAIRQEAEKQKNYFVEKPSIFPVTGRITSEFGSRIHPLFDVTSFHEGIDIANLAWTPVMATADGICTYSGVKGSYGNMIEITHRGSGYVTRYAHLKNANLKVGDIVKRYDVIGNLGNSGVSTGPHLHYEVRMNGRPINPRANIIYSDFDCIID